MSQGAFEMQRMQAAILEKHNAPLALKELTLDDPHSGEVLVKIVTASICHTDIGAIEGHYSTVPLPVVLGHESAGIVEKVGEGVEDLRAGDSVVASVVVHCGRCRSCLSGKFYACEKFNQIAFEGNLPSGGKRLKDGEGHPVAHFFAQSSFASHAVIPAVNLVRVPQGVPIEHLSPLSCSVQTGAGAAINSGMEGGSTFAIFGCGGVGLSAILGARTIGASEIIAVDIAEDRLKLAEEFGATVAINPKATQDVAKEIRAGTGGGVDCAIECIGREATIMGAIDCTKPFGTTILVGIPPRGTQLQLDFNALFNKNVRGCIAGYANSSTFLPYLVKLHMQGRLPLDRMCSKPYSLDRINEAVEDMKSGRIIKPLLKF